MESRGTVKTVPYICPYVGDNTPKTGITLDPHLLIRNAT